MGALFPSIAANSVRLTVPAGIVAWWPADGNARDIVGTNRSEVVGLTGFVEGVVGRAFRFNGLDDEVMNSVSGLTNIVDTFTMEFWAWPAAGRDLTPETRSLGWGTENQRYAIFPDWGGDEGAGAGVSVGTNGVSVFEHGNCYLPALLVYNAPIVGWTHIAVVYENKQPKLYLNGKLVRAGLVSPRSFVYPSTWLGGRGLEAGNYGHYSGLLDEISIYDRALSTNEITDIYATGATGKSHIPPSANAGKAKPGPGSGSEGRRLVPWRGTRLSDTRYHEKLVLIMQLRHQPIWFGGLQSRTHFCISETWTLPISMSDFTGSQQND